MSGDGEAAAGPGGTSEPSAFRDRSDYTLFILGAIVALTTLAIGGIIGIEVFAEGDTVNPTVATIVGLTSPTIVALMALLKSSQSVEVGKRTSAKLDTVARSLNGDLDARMKGIVHEVMNEREKGVTE